MRFHQLVISLFLLPAYLCAQEQAPPKLDAAARKAVVASVQHALNNYYVFPEKAKAMSELLAKQDKAGAYWSLTVPSEFADRVLTDIRSVQNDAHLRIIHGPELEADIIRFTSSKSGAEAVTEADIQQEEARNFRFEKAEVLPSNIGLLAFTGFARPSPSARRTVNAAMRFVAHTDAVILDLRNNSGGDGTMAQEIASYFFNTPVTTGRTYDRIADQWTEEQVGGKPSITDSLTMDMPVYILTSSRTFSAAEGLAYTLKTLRGALIVGDTTRGGAHLTRSFALGHGFVAFIPYTRSENIKTRTDWEGTGVIPDIIAADDMSLATAQIAILEQEMAAATDSTRKKKLQWTINYHRSKTSTAVPDPSALTRFAGRYAEFEITADGPALFFRDVNQPNGVPRQMTAITPVLFQDGYDHQIEFIRDPDGACGAIDMRWEDGWTEIIKRTP